MVAPFSKKISHAFSKVTLETNLQILLKKKTDKKPGTLFHLALETVDTANFLSNFYPLFTTSINMHPFVLFNFFQ